MSKFKTGDVVYLKSGGVAMTVSDQTRGEELIDTHWFNTKNELQRDAFHQDVVCKAEDFK